MTGPVVPVLIWPGSGSDPTGLTPFGIFDDDDVFVEDAPKVAKFVAFSLGYPVMAVELTDEIIYSQFEQAVVEFSAQVNEFNMRENMLGLQGASTASSFSQVLIKSSPLPYTVEVSQMYGTEAGVGGYVSYKKGYITMRNGVQDYDLNSLWANVSESGNRIEIRRIWHERPPAINRFFDPFAGGAGQGIGIQNLLGEFGWGSYSVASQYLLMPMYETLLRVQAIELNDTVRRSQYGFEIKNNQLRLFPVPVQDDDGMRMWFEYVVVKDKYSSQVGAPGTTGSYNGSAVVASSAVGGVVSDFSNAPFDTILYRNVNDVGRRWVWKYTLALCKIVLGSSIRSKYDRIPIPNSDVVLNGLQLAQEGVTEKEQLVEQLRETLVQTGKQAQLEKAVDNETRITELLKRVPQLIYIG